MTSRRASITEINAVKLTKDTLGDSRILVDSSIAPPSSSLYVSPAEAYSFQEQSALVDHGSSSLKLVSPEKSVELYRDVHGFKGEHFGLYKKRLDFSHIPKSTPEDRRRMYILLQNLMLEHRLVECDKYNIGWNALFVLSRAHYEEIGLKSSEINLLLNTLQYVRELDASSTQLGSNTAKKGPIFSGRRKSMIKKTFDNTIGDKSLDSSIRVTDKEILVDSTSLKPDIDLPIPLSMYRNREFFTRKRDESKDKYKDNPFYGQNMNEFMGGIKYIKAGNGGK